MTHTDPRAGDYAVATHGLSKRYGRETALDHVDLRVPDGAVYVLVGVNGAGKSTLFKVLMNLERPDAGTAEVFGLDTGRDGPEVRAQVGYVPERQDAPYRSMTCAPSAPARGGLLPGVGPRLRRPPHSRPRRPAAAAGRRAVEGRDETPPARAGARVPPSAPAARRADGRPRPGGPAARAGAAGRAPGRRADHRPRSRRITSTSWRASPTTSACSGTGAWSHRCRARSCSARCGATSWRCPTGGRRRESCRRPGCGARAPGATSDARWWARSGRSRGALPPPGLACAR